MPTLIEGSIEQGGRIADDRWVAVETMEASRSASASASLLIPFALWTSERERFDGWSGQLGVIVEPDVDPATVAADLERFSLIAIRFPKFTDGRGYSIARLLRERYGYLGTLRAVGDVLRDQLFYMLRCGFDSFAMAHDDHLDAALAAYHDFSDAYQTAVDRKRPLFARRDACIAKAATSAG